MKVMELDNLTYADLFQKLSLLLHSGIPISSGLLILSEEEQDPTVQKPLVLMAQQTEDGSTFYDALSCAGCFPAYAVGLLEVAERVGRLEETLLSLSRYYEDRDRINRTIRNALTYPSLLVLMMFAVIVILLSRVLPIFDQVYGSLGGSLTGVAGGLLVLGELLNTALPFLGILIGIIAIAAAIASLIPAVRIGFKKLTLRITGDRGIWKKVNSAHFAQALAMALACGLRMEEGLELAAKLLADSPAAVRRSQNCYKQFVETSDLVASLRDSDILSPASCQMLTISIRAGNADTTMQQIAARMSDEADEAMEKKTAMIEPVLVLVTSVMVGVILLSVMIPLINIMKVIG